MKKLILSLSFGLLLLGACRKNSNFTEVEIIEEEPIVLVVSHFLGRVVNAEGVGVINPMIAVGDAIMMADHNGVFEDQNLLVKKRGEVLIAKEDHYFDGLFWTDNRALKTRFVELALVEKEQKATFLSEAGADLVLDDGVQLQFGPGSTINSNGQTPTGEVLVKSKWLDPTVEESKALFPNSFTAEGEEGAELILTNFGLLLLNLENETGEVLELTNESKATIQLPVPSNLSNNTPTNLSFWIFDVDEKKWLKESEAQLQNGFYQGEVSKVGMIAVAKSHTPVCVTGKIVEHDLASSPFYKVEIEATNTHFQTWNYTDDSGDFCALIPEDTPIRLKVYDHCHTLVYEKELGSFLSDTPLSEISLSANTSTSDLEIIGDVYDCGVNAPIDGRLIIEYPGQGKDLEVHSLSHFKPNWKMMAPYSCADFPSLRITAYNRRQKLQSTPIKYNTASNFSLGLIRTCDPPQEFFNYSRSNQAFKNAPALFDLAPIQGQNELIISAGQGFGEVVVLSIKNYDGLGSYSDEVSLTIIGDPNLEIHNQNAQINITRDDGLYIQGQVELELINTQTGKTSTLSGEFKARKKL